MANHKGAQAASKKVWLADSNGEFKMALLLTWEEIFSDADGEFLREADR